MKKKLLISTLLLGFSFIGNITPAYATDDDYSQAAGHTGVYVNVNNVFGLKCNIKTYDHSKINNKLGWYTAWPMIVDYQTNKFVQIGYITSPLEKIDKPTFYVAWSNDGNQINVKYLPDKTAIGNAILERAEHEYALTLNTDGSVNIQIDGVKYLESLEDNINIGIKEGTGEFFSEGSNLGIDITTEFNNCHYKLRGDATWRELEQNESFLLYHVNDGTSIERTAKNSFIIKGRIKKINKGKFLKKIQTIINDKLKKETKLEEKKESKKGI